MKDHVEYRVLYPSGNYRKYSAGNEYWARLIFEAARDCGKCPGVRLQKRIVTNWEDVSDGPH
jgi:hypothetical protein